MRHPRRNVGVRGTFPAHRPLDGRAIPVGQYCIAAVVAFAHARRAVPVAICLAVDLEAIERACRNRDFLIALAPPRRFPLAMPGIVAKLPFVTPLHSARHRESETLTRVFGSALVQL